MRSTVFFAAALAAVLALAGPAAAAPRLELSTTAWDFGEIYQWTNPSINVGIKNAGDEPLEIKDVKASCGCTATFLSSKVIAPGDKGFLKIDFASYMMTGKVSKLIRLVTNDPDAPQRDISVKGFVKNDKAAVGKLEKDRVDLGVVAPYETRELAVLVNNRGNKDLDIEDIRLPGGYFMDSGFPTRAKPRGGIEVRFGYRPPKDKGPIDDVIRFKTSGIDGGVLELRVVGYVSDCARVSDELVVTPTGFDARRADGKELTFSVKNNGRAAVAVEGVDCSLEVTGIESGAPEIKPGQAGTIKVDLPPSELPAGTKGYVYIRLGLPVELK